MSESTIPVTVTILDREYRVACREEDKEALLASARYLSDKMREIRDSGKIVGVDRIAVMAALNITNEFLSEREEHSRARRTTDERIRALVERIDEALEATDEEATPAAPSTDAPAEAEVEPPSATDATGSD